MLGSEPYMSQLVCHLSGGNMADIWNWGWGEQDERQMWGDIYIYIYIYIYTCD